MWVQVRLLTSKGSLHSRQSHPGPVSCLAPEMALVRLTPPGQDIQGSFLEKLNSLRKKTLATDIWGSPSKKLTCCSVILW